MSTQTAALKAPFPWFGGKSRASGLIWERFGYVPNYVEPFAGSLAVLLRRPTEPRLETVNDKDCYLANFWRAVRSDPEEVAYWADWPVNEADLHARHRWLVAQDAFAERMRRDVEHYDARIAGWWVWGISQWIGSGWCSRPDWEGRFKAGGDRPRGVHSLWEQRPQLGSRNGAHSQPEKRPHINSRSTGGVHGQLPALQGSKGIEVRRGAITEWMTDLAERLRAVRVCCGDWQRVVTPSVTWKVGGSMLTGVLLDPPYDLRRVMEGTDGAAPSDSLYNHDNHDLSAEVRTWAIENGENPLLRIGLCGLDGEHEMPPEWDCVAWKANGGYGNQSEGGARNANRERIWFSPHCLKANQASLF